MGMAPADNPKIVVAIVLEQDGTEGDGAARARQVIMTALKTEGLL